jgi:hypothetical protein
LVAKNPVFRPHPTTTDVYHQKSRAICPGFQYETKNWKGITYKLLAEASGGQSEENYTGRKMWPSDCPISSPHTKSQLVSLSANETFLDGHVFRSTSVFAKQIGKITLIIFFPAFPSSMG